MATNPTATSLALAKQEQDLKLQAMQLSAPTDTGFGKQLMQQAVGLQTPTVASGVLKAIALGMGGQAQRAEAKTKDEKNAQMAAYLEQQVAKTQQLKEMEAHAQQKATSKAYIASNAPVITSALEMAVSPNATPETVAQANNTVTNLFQSYGKDTGTAVNNASIDSANQLVNLAFADGTSQQISFPELIATVGESNPDMQKDMQARLYPDLATRQATKEGQQAGVKDIATRQAIVDQLGTSINEATKQAILSGTKLTGDVGGVDLKNAEAKGKISGVIFADKLLGDINSSIFAGGDIEAGEINDSLILGADFNFPNSEGRTLVAQTTAALNSILRLESGAAVPEPEIERYLKIYMPTTLDNDNTKRVKVRLLNDRIKSIKDAFGVVDPALPAEDQQAMLDIIMKQKISQAEKEVKTLSSTPKFKDSSKNQRLLELRAKRDAGEI